MKKLSIAYIKASWHAEIVYQSLVGFKAEMKALGVDFEVTTYDVPGAFEMPLLAQKLGHSGKFDAIVAAALVVDGGIYRHDFVAQAVVSGLMTAQMETGVPTYSVSLTPHNFQSEPYFSAFFTAHFTEKGAEAARAVHMIAGLDLPKSG
jgi:6,7-dimethyl-8-ribityllumazine synthase